MTNLTMFQFFHWYYLMIAAYGNTVQSRLNTCTGWELPTFGCRLLISLPTERMSPAMQCMICLTWVNLTKKEAYQPSMEPKRIPGCIRALHDHKMQVLGDIVLNHKMGQMKQRLVKVKQVNPENQE